MADSKITALTAISTVDPTADPLVIVDVSDTSMAASGTTKKSTINQLLGAGGTATLASATITGDLTVDTSTLKVDSANNRVGIGTATPADILDIYSPLGTAAIKLQTGANIAFSLNSQIPGVSNNGFSIYDVTASANRLTIDSSANVNVVGGNLIIGTSGKGIDFSATASGSGTMTSELLSDYEEGTFTPTIIGTSTAGTGTYSVQSGTYTKVGRLVSCQIFLNWTAHTGTGDMRITGLPFQVSGASNYFAAATIGYLSNVSLSAGNIATGYAINSTSVITLGQYPTGGGTAAGIAMDTSGEILISVNYVV